MKKRETLLRKALLFAIVAHSGVYRKNSGVDYIYHPVSVARLVRKYKTSKNLEILLVCALLHDTIEDVDWVTTDVIRSEFGEMVANIVSELTNDDEEIKRIGKDQYMVSKIIKMSSYALVIKLADRLHNCSDLVEFNEETRNRYVKQTRNMINSLNHRYLSNTHKKQIQDLSNTICVYE